MTFQDAVELVLQDIRDRQDARRRAGVVVGKAHAHNSHARRFIDLWGERPIDSIERLRTVLASTTLEGVFAQLVIRDDPAQLATDLADLSALSA